MGASQVLGSLYKYSCVGFFINLEAACFHHADPKSFSAVLVSLSSHPVLALGFDLFAPSPNLVFTLLFLYF